MNRQITFKTDRKVTSKDLSFVEHINDLVQSSKIKVGWLLRTFRTREAGPIVKMFNSDIHVVI